MTALHKYVTLLIRWMTPDDFAESICVLCLFVFVYAHKYFAFYSNKILCQQFGVTAKVLFL